MEIQQQELCEFFDGFFELLDTFPAVQELPETGPTLREYVYEINRSLHRLATQAMLIRSKLQSYESILFRE